MYRSHTCGALSIAETNEKVMLSGWVQKIRNKGFMIWIDIRDRYGITQLVFDEKRTPEALFEKAKSIGREFVIKVIGTVIERESRNENIPTGAIEVLVSELTVLNKAAVPPFTIEDDTDGGEDIRMKYRYLDIRRNPIKNNLIFRHKITMEVRNYLSGKGFIEVETPYLIKSTPEGARDFVVPSRINKGEFYALPQSPQLFKQLLMVGGMDRYFQIVKCFRDEDLRADRQPEFTQIDCEMAFADQDTILQTFEALLRDLLKTIKGIDIPDFPRITYDEAMKRYGNDKPDIRFGMELRELSTVVKQRDFKVFNTAEFIAGIVVPGAAMYTRKEIDRLTAWVKRPQIGASGMIYVKCNDDGSYITSVGKFYSQEDLAQWAIIMEAKPGDLMLILSGETAKTRARLSALRMEMATRLKLRNPEEFAPLWVTDFPLLEWDEETERYHAMHHPFTAPKPEDIERLVTSPRTVRANAYDLVLNGNEIGGGSVRIHDKELQSQLFSLLGFSQEQAEAQFGFLLKAFQYGTPPHGGIALGLDRLVAILGGQEMIRDFIAFPKNNAGRDVMVDAPAPIDEQQLKELHLKT